jgi:hypothetical protein
MSVVTTRRLVMVLLFAIIVLSESGLIGFAQHSSLVHPANGIIVGPIHFMEIYFTAGAQLEKRMPRVGEEFRITARVRNEGPTTIYYLPTFCDTSLSAIFDPFYVRVESGRPRCLAASMPTPLKLSEEANVSAPESGTAYVATRAGSTTVTVVYAYNEDPMMNPATQQEARNTIPLTVQASQGFSIPGFPIESLLLGFALALAIMAYRYYRIKDSARGPSTATPTILVSRPMNR